MQSFCSNAGPAFVFGILGFMFSKKVTLLVLWLVHIVSALLVAWILPRQSDITVVLKQHQDARTNIIVNCIKSLGVISVWIILFRILIDLLPSQYLQLIPQYVRTLLSGLLELTNGCIALQELNSEGERFILGSIFLSFGGLCIVMQTASLTKNLRTSLYICGKILQSVFSFFISTGLQYVLFDTEEQWHIPNELFTTVIIIAVIAFLYLNKKTVAFLQKMLYNTKNDEVRYRYVIQEKDSPILQLLPIRDKAERR